MRHGPSPSIRNRIFVCSLAVFAAAAQTSVTTYHNDDARTGEYLSEILLTPANVKPGLFGKRFSHPIDGPAYAQPLYLSRVKIAGQGFHNIVLVATGHDSLYAFDADDDSGSNAQPLWQVSFIDPGHGVTAVPADDVNCQVIWPELGIIGTPVIDAAAGTIYLMAETKEPGPAYVFRLHAIDVTSGAERPGSPVVIQPSGFSSFWYKQRGALLLRNGVVYSPWSANCDLGSYHGFVLAHDAKTLKLIGAFNDTPAGNGASFWNGGAGPAADAEGNIYMISANGDFDANAGNYGDSVIKLSPAPQLSVRDFFTPFNQDFLNLNDIDLGSAGALLLPEEAGSPAHPHLLFAVGKEGRMYLLDRDAMGGAQSGSDSRALASLPVLPHSVFGAAAYFNGSIYVAPESMPLGAFRVSNASLASQASAKAPDTIGLLGATPSISADGNANGIVWTVSSDNFGTLRAYNAANLAALFDSNTKPSDNLGGFAEFAVPTIAGGKVYVGQAYNLVVYGELGSDPPAIAAVTNAASFLPDRISPGSLISLFGSGLAPVAASASAVPLPLSVADVSVTINGVTAPLLYVSPAQINAQVPFGIKPGPATVVVRAVGQSSLPVNISVAAASPGIFTDLHGAAAALNANHSRNDAQHPAAVGSYVSIFFTGQGPL
ncbi:MAG TPA: hypothetical protein VJN43_04085, partial [Bryobacteraceae bacterium]|nr:hypothetical protein [Bryobacteraceae bacterium]